MTTAKLASIIEGILFVAGKSVEINEIAEKLEVTKKDINEAVALLKERYNDDSGINLLTFSSKLQLSSNPKYINEVSNVLNPIREKELTRAMLESMAIIAYKQPITRLEIEDIRGVDCTYAVHTLSKMNLIEVVGRKDAIGKPLLFGTTEEFLKRFSLESVDELPDYSELLKRVKTISASSSTDLYNSNRNMEFERQLAEQGAELPEHLKGEDIERIE